MAHYGGKTGTAFQYSIEAHTVHGGANVTMTLSPSSGPLGKSSPSEPPWDQNYRNFQKPPFTLVLSKRWLFLCVQLAVQSHIPPSQVGQLAFRVFGKVRKTYGLADPGVRSLLSETQVYFPLTLLFLCGRATVAFLQDASSWVSTGSAVQGRRLTAAQNRMLHCFLNHSCDS